MQHVPFYSFPHYCMRSGAVAPESIIQTKLFTRRFVGQKQDIGRYCPPGKQLSTPGGINSSHKSSRLREHCLGQSGINNNWGPLIVISLGGSSVQYPWWMISEPPISDWREVSAYGNAKNTYLFSSYGIYSNTACRGLYLGKPSSPVGGGGISANVMGGGGIWKKKDNRER